MRSFKSQIKKSDQPEFENICKSDAGRMIIDAIYKELGFAISQNEYLSESRTQFECANWDYKQAYDIGYRRALKDVCSKLLVL